MGLVYMKFYLLGFAILVTLLSGFLPFFISSCCYKLKSNFQHENRNKVMASILVRYSSAFFLCIASLILLCLGFSGLITTAASVTTSVLAVPIQSLAQIFSVAWAGFNFNFQLRIDTLASFFLLLIGTILLPLSWYLPQYFKSCISFRTIKMIAFFTAIFIASMVLVVLAGNVLTFMFAWELMSLSSYFLVAYDYKSGQNQHAAFIYLVMAHISGLLILVGFAACAKVSGSYSFIDWQHLQLAPFWTGFVFIFSLLGFGMKAGLVPLHVWLPQAHPAAPSPISALMSGVMIKIAVYGFIRCMFGFITLSHWQMGGVVLLLGTITAFWGVMYALMQHDLKRLLAYHSIENIGIIFMGIGLAMIFSALQHPTLAALGLIAALFHCLNHALFKSLLFISAGTIIQQIHTHNLNRMGGVIKRMPWTAVCFLIGCLSIAALPPFNGFVSEWLTFQGLLQIKSLPVGVLRILFPLGAAILALTGALAATCFVKVYGVVFLGNARDQNLPEITETSWGGRAGQALLALLCLVCGVLPTLVIKILDVIPVELIGANLQSQIFSWWWLVPTTVMPTANAVANVVAGGAIATTAYGALFLAGFLIVVFMLLYFVARPRDLVRVKPWDCGYGGLTATMQYTSTAFAMPIRRAFQAFWKISEEKQLSHDAKQPLAVNKIIYNIEVHDWSWVWWYQPWRKAIDVLSASVAKVQSGSLRLYLTYMFVVLVLLLCLICY